ncbi:MAG TPA: Plug domain-containing protein [Longimicrobiales bacterium]|nr:Plug domain-containing protein [Longimicrobiales bacterium]
MGAKARALTFVGLALLLGAPARAQVRPDSTQAADTLAADTLAADTLLAEGDTVPPADTIFHNLPRLERPIPPGFAPGVWTWTREDIMARGANTLAELLADVPGLVALRGGDYGAPLAVSALGGGGGGVRILRDGFELVPLEGGVVDLQRVGLGGIEEVRLERHGIEMLVELTSYRYTDGRPFTLVEAGTGQLDTNVFRGTYADPTALLGSLAFSLERVDTRGWGQNEGGNRTGWWLRYQLHAGDRAGLAVDLRRMSSETEVSQYAAGATRTDVTVRGRWEVLDGVSLEAYTGRSEHEVDDDRPAYGFEGGRRAQHGVRLGLAHGGAWVRGAFRLYPDDDLPSQRIDGAAGYDGSRFGAWATVRRARWAGSPVGSGGGGGWIGPIAGITAFGSYESGTLAARAGPVLDERPPAVPPFAPPAPSTGPAFDVAERSLLRLGGQLSLFGVDVAGAWLRLETDAQLPLQTELDRGAVPAAGADRTGLEAWASLPTPWRSLRLEGSYQRWDTPGPYLPEELYQAGFVFHRTYLESGNFELSWSFGVRGHDPMLVFLADDGSGAPGLAQQPFYQSWYGTVQARILTVRLFLGWENITRRRNLQDFPGRVLPIMRSFFGLHWDLWN